MIKIKWSTPFVSVFIFCAMALPGYCSTSFDFTVGTGAGTFVTTGGNSLFSMSGISFTELTVAGDPNSSLNGNYTITGGSLSEQLIGSTEYLVLTGAIGSLSGISAGTTLMEIAVANTVTAAGSNPATVKFATSPADITYGSQLLSDLGISANTAGGCALSTSCVISGDNPTVSGSQTTWTAFSEGINTTLVATPEPVSFLLTGGGLLFVGGLARRKRKA